MDQKTKDAIHEKMKHIMNREPLEKEINNSLYDPSICLPVLLQRIIDLEEEVFKKKIK